jgi:YidC/Oxa1 family membrane protein insertase
MPDTVGHLGGFAINLLPLIMAVTQLLQMHLMPAPSTDAKMQRIMKFMPLIYLGFFYTMPAGMIMYYTLSNLFTILQQYLTRRSMDEPIAEPATPAKAKSRRR